MKNKYLIEELEKIEKQIDKHTDKLDESFLNSCYPYAIKDVIELLK